MNKKLHNIQTKPITIVTSKCPLNIFRMGYSDDRKFDNCKRCDFFISDNKCGYDSYETTLIKHDSYTEPEDGFGVMPDTDYMWNFKCSKCGHTIRFISGYSVLQNEDTGKCFECKTKHRYIKNENEIYYFAIPITNVK